VVEELSAFQEGLCSMELVRWSVRLFVTVLAEHWTLLMN